MLLRLASMYSYTRADFLHRHHDPKPTRAMGLAAKAAPVGLLLVRVARDAKVLRHDVGPVGVLHPREQAAQCAILHHTVNRKPDNARFDETRAGC